MKKTSKKSNQNYALVVGIAVVLTLGTLAFIKANLSRIGKPADINLATNPLATPTIACSASFTIPGGPSPTPTPITSPSPTPSPIASSAPCIPCQYQADLFWGPLITSFKGNVRYSTGNRLITSTYNRDPAVACNLNSTVSSPAPSYSQPSAGCENPVVNGYLTGTLNRGYEALPKAYLMGTVTNTTSKCTYTVGIATYKKNDIADKEQNIEAQNLYDYKLVTILPGQTVQINAKTPMVSDSNACHQMPQ